MDEINSRERGLMRQDENSVGFVYYSQKGMRSIKLWYQDKVKALQKKVS